MLKRILVAVVFVPLIFVLFFLAPPWCLPIVTAAISMIAVHEVLWSTGFVKNVRISCYSIVLAGLIPIWVYFSGGMYLALAGILVYVVLLFSEAISSHYTVTMEKMGGAFFFSVIIPMFLASFIRISKMELGIYMVLMPLVAAFTSDAFALFAGMLFGKHKLAPELSPKKTVEGSVGGFVGAIVCMMIYGAIMQFGFQLQAHYLLLALYGAAGSAISQLGDLSFSYIKRQYKIKDYGNILPGHGGILDRFDSVILCAPLIELLIIFLPALAL
ncbi:MAG: phosphatidate cytidylyltransferase [Oscillospiraceae bacterium]